MATITITIEVGDMMEPVREDDELDGAIADAVGVVESAIDNALSINDLENLDVSVEVS